MPGLSTRPPIQQTESVPLAIHHVKTTASLARANKSISQYCKFLPVRIKGMAASALIDSGNVWRNAISKQFFDQLGLTQAQISPMPGVSVGTAQASAKLDVLGELSKPLHIQFDGLDTKFKFQPVVIKNLAMDINICGPFLRQHSIDQIHSENALKIQGQLVKLYPIPHTTLVVPEATHSCAYLTEDVIVPPYAVAHVPLRIAQIEQKLMPPGDGILSMGEDPFGNNAKAKKRLVGWSDALVTVGEGGTVRAGIMNVSGDEVTLHEGTKYGDFIRTCSQEESKHMPWRICLVGAGDGHADKGPTLRQKLADAIAKARKKRKEPEEGQEEKAREARLLKSREGRRRWIEEKFKLKEAPALRNQGEREAVVRLLEKYFDTISANGEYGQTDLMEHEIHTEKVPPIKCKHRPINPALEPDLKEQMDKWVKHDVVEPSCSPWSFPLVAAPKKNGTIRWCVDYRRLNDVTIKDTFPLPNIEDNLVRLADSRIFSCVDGSGAFHVIKIKKEDRPKTAFSTPWGTFHYKRMPFGLTNGPASYSRLVQLVLHGIPQEAAIPYLDDTIIHSKDVAGHLRNLELVLKAHRKAGLKLQPEKCQLFQKQVDYLGHLVSAEGIRPQEAYLKVVRDWQIPSTKSEARVFLGKVGYYRRFIKNYSKIARPWTDVTGVERTGDVAADKAAEKTPLQITPEMRSSFTELKSRLLQAPVLAYPRFHSDEPFILDTDWSQESGTIGGVLSQMQDGKERAILFGAKKLAKSQDNYAPTKGELTALLHFCKAWKYYLRHRPFIFRTDHKPLLAIKTMEPQDNHMSRMLDTLANYDMNPVYRAGKSHGNADALSRAPHVQKEEPPAQPVGTDEEVLGVQALRGRMDREDLLPYSPEELSRKQEEDEDLRIVKKWVKEAASPSTLEVRSLSPEVQIYASQIGQLSLDRYNILRYSSPEDEVPSRRLCVPTDLQRTVIRSAHEGTGHFAVEKIVDLLSRRFYFPHMRKMVDLVLKGCQSCQRKGQTAKPQKAVLASPSDGYPFQRLCLDFVGPLPLTRRGNEYILTIRDSFTKWLEAVPCDEPTQRLSPRF